jgi:hypothetical protein
MGRIVIKDQQVVIIKANIIKINIMATLKIIKDNHLIVLMPNINKIQIILAKIIKIPLLIFLLILFRQM